MLQSPGTRSCFPGMQDLHSQSIHLLRSQIASLPPPFHSLCPAPVPFQLQPCISQRTVLPFRQPSAPSVPYHAAPSSSISWARSCTSPSKPSNTDHSPTASGSSHTLSSDCPYFRWRDLQLFGCTLPGLLEGSCRTSHLWAHFA